MEEADNYDIVISHFKNPVWSEILGWIEFSKVMAAAESRPRRRCRGVTTEVILNTNWHGRKGMTPEEKQNMAKAKKRSRDSIAAYAFEQSFKNHMHRGRQLRRYRQMLEWSRGHLKGVEAIPEQRHLSDYSR